MTATTLEFNQLSLDISRAEVLRREIGMLRVVQSHLRGIPARHNLTRIAERVELLGTLDTLIRLSAEG